MTEAQAPRRWHEETSWDDLPLQEHQGGVKTRSFVVGHPDHSDGPIILWVQFPPGYTVAPHTHDCDYTEMILEGTQQVTRRWYGPGAIRIVQAGTVYGPLIAGPEGVTALIIFASKHAMQPRWVDGTGPTQSADGYEAPGT